MMHSGFQGRYFRTARTIVRWLYPPAQLPDREDFPQPCVLVCRHRNMLGPILSMCWLKTHVHPWIYHVFCERESCYRHFRDYTLTVRLRFPKWFARCVAWLGGVFVPPLLRSMGGIAVYRESAQSIRTIRESMRCLLRKESLIIFPDIDYTNVTTQIGKLYDGFVLLAHLYRQKTGEPLAFVPMAVASNHLAFGEIFYASMQDITDAARAKFVEEIALRLQQLDDEPT